MQVCVFTEPQEGASYADQARHARAAEALGFHGWFRSDHFLAGDGDGLPGPTDAWTTLAGLAVETERVRLGTLVTSATFRFPGVLAVQAAQVDAMSGGRVDLGLGAGWFEAEHRVVGAPFPARRFDRLEEALTILTGLWSTPAGERFSHAGPTWPIEDSPALPKPVQSPLPIIVGGLGAKRTPELAARFAAEYNANWADEAELARAFERVGAALDARDRPRSDLRLSVAQHTVVGRTEAEFRARAERIGADPRALRDVHLGGTVAEVADRIGRYEAMGVGRVYLQTVDLTDLDHLELLATLL